MLLTIHNNFLTLTVDTLGAQMMSLKGADGCEYLWQGDPQYWPKTDAPYVCIEPWTSLPSRQDVVEEFSCKSDMIQLEPGKTYENTWAIAIHTKGGEHD